MELARRRIDLAAASGLIYSIALVLTNIILLRWVVRSVPESEAGYWILGQTIGNYVLLFDLGFSPVLSRNIGLLSGAEQRDQIAVQVATARRCVYAIAIFALVGLSLFGFTLSEAVRLPWWIFSVGASLNLAGGVNLAILNGLTFVSLERWIRICGLSVLILTTWLALEFRLGLLGLSVAWVLHGAFVRLVAYFFANKKLSIRAGQFSWNVLNNLWKPALQWSITALGAIMILQSGAPILATFHGPGILPSFEALAKISAALMTGGLLLASASAPSISHLYGQGKAHDAIQLIFRNQRIGLSITASAAMFIVIFGSQIIQTWLGAKFDPGFNSRAIYILMSFFEVHHVIWASAVVAVGPVPFAIAALLSGFVTVALAVILVPKYGVTGMALATFLAQAFTNNWYAPYFAFRHFDIKLIEYWKYSLRFVLLSATWSLAIGLTLYYIEIENLFQVVPVYFGLCAPLLLWILKHEPTKV